MVKIKTIASAAGALMAGTVAAQAGGIERQAFNPGFLFESGNYFEMTFGSVSPSVSGFLAAAPVINSGNMAGSYTTLSGSLKYQLTDDFAVGVIVDQPIGVDVAYPAGTGYPFSTASATVDALQLSVLGHYRLSPNFSVYGGLRAERVEGIVDNVNLGGGPTYDMRTSAEVDYGYVVGVAYERPEIALRVALSYLSAITHDFVASDSFGPGADFSTTVPQGVNLDFQTGVAANTLVFGSIRWRDWSEFTIIPRGTIPLSSDNKDTISYSLGVGRKFTDTFSGSLSVGFEPAGGDVVGNLGPTDGYKSVTLAGVYTAPNGMKVTVGASRGWIGDARTNIGLTQGVFTDNSFTAVGMKVGWSF